MTIGAEGLGTASFVSLDNGSTAPVSLANQGRIRYNTTLQRAELSHNTGPYLPFIGDITVGTMAQLSAIADLGLDDGAIAGVRTLMCAWQLNKTSVAVVDGITVIATLSGVGRWCRLSTPNRCWQLQATWYLDELAGGDENSGGVGFPLATYDEFERRIGKGVSGFAYTINVLSDITVDIVVHTDADVTFVGQRTLLYTGSVTGYQAYVYATNTDGQLTDAAIPASWTASGLVGQLLVMTSGAHVGHTTFVAVDLGGLTASVAELYGGGLHDQPGIGDTFKVYSLTQVSWVYHRGSGSVTLRDLDVSVDSFGQILCQTCTLAGATFNGPSAVLRGCHTQGAIAVGGPLSVNETAFCGMISVGDNGRVTIGTASIMCRVATGGVFVYDGGRLTVGPSGALGFYDFPPGTWPLVVYDGGCADIQGYCHGARADTPSHWLWVDAGGRVVQPAATNFLNVAGSTAGDVLVGTSAVTNALAHAGLVDATTLAGVLVNQVF